MINFKFLVMKQFEMIKVKKPKRSVFDLSHERKFSCNMGDLVPCLLMEILPGDKVKINFEAFLRLMPTLAPIMHRVNVYVHMFYVPNRIIYDDWEKFLTGGRLGTEEPNLPKLTGTHDNFQNVFGSPGTLADYLGLPIENYQDDPSKIAPSVSQLPFRAYQKIWYDYYRDQTLDDDETQLTGSLDYNVENATVADLISLKKRNWEKDYFTSALPFTQRGDEVLLPLGESAPVSGIPLMYSEGHTPPTAGTELYSGITDGRKIQVLGDGDIAYFEGLSADLSEATASSINTIRRAFSLQRWLEKNARAGARLIEHVLIHFGVKSSDARLQRAEYIGGGKLPISIGEVLQTSETSTTVQGNMSGHGMAAGNAVFVNKYFEEHGFLMGIISIMPRTAYSQGIPKIFSKFDKFDFYYPDFANVGEQPVLNQELYLDLEASNNEATFGYQPRYSEYRFMWDTVHGEFRETLDYWTMYRKFYELPVLNKDFINSDPTNRVFPVLDGSHKCLIQSYAKVMAIRAVSKFGDPI